MDASDVGTIFSTFVGDVGSILTTNLPTVLGVAAALIGLGMLIRFVKKHIGRKA